MPSVHATALEVLQAADLARNDSHGDLPDSREDDHSAGPTRQFSVPLSTSGIRRPDPRLLGLLKGGRLLVEMGCGAGTYLDEAEARYDVTLGFDLRRTRFDSRTSAPVSW